MEGKSLKKKDFLIHSGLIKIQAGWLAVVLAVQVPKDNLLQNILQNPLCWLRLRAGSKGHKYFALKLQVLNFLPGSL